MTRSSAQPRLRDRLREETNRAILEAAEHEFAGEGLHAARMERIAARAGVAVGTVYNHFSDREALLGALARSRRERLLARVDAALAAAKGEPVAAQLRAYLEAITEHARAHGPFLTVLVQAGEGPARARPARLGDELTARVDAVVRRGIATGELRKDEAGVFALAFVGMVRIVLTRSIQDDAPFERASGALLELFLRGAHR
ncbi:TetR/AcrR family transcriptional regulator [Anaeromyxobacter terrae]|uniref:TetR/AcrR family transcriptional regulator n=1 Tax=Anaeromyxobacter terrae TaxID=2925406 RepID=UPI001F5936E2|nr:TetR/AcrR family transcriptional regulator [Anaeromyxobacter sp. SG22]